ncbi:alpha/beta fold hydrolase [Streptomyces sp. LMG1-1-1.1]|uniref:alpha/beta fold hydrolase n=1 Tax=Streptomyces sp. LMG1-1-1.1 TaxID=3135245 RepID=UPI003467AE08
MITFDNRGVGASGGVTPDTVEAMVRDAVLFTPALNFEQVDLLGLSMGGFISLTSFRAQLRAIRRCCLQPPADLSRIGQPFLVANGESDRMVPSENTLDLAARLPRGELVPLYPDARHGGIFQCHDEFVAQAPQ